MAQHSRFADLDPRRRPAIVPTARIRGLEAGNDQRADRRSDEQARMSLRAMTWVWTLDISPAPKLVLMAIADNADDAGFCFPSQRRVAKKCSITERSVRRLVGKLIAARLVVVEPRYRVRARTTNGYRLTMDHPRTSCPGGAASAVQGERTTLSVSGGLCFPSSTSLTQRRAIQRQLVSVAPDVAQQILDELAGRIAIGNVRSPVRYATELTRRSLRDAFEPELGVRIARERAALRQRDRRGEKQGSAAVDASDTPVAQLPDELRLPLERLRAKAFVSQQDDGFDDGLLTCRARAGVRTADPEG